MGSTSAFGPDTAPALALVVDRRNPPAVRAEQAAVGARPAAGPMRTHWARPRTRRMLPFPATSGRGEGRKSIRPAPRNPRLRRTSPSAGRDSAGRGTHREPMRERHHSIPPDDVQLKYDDAGEVSKGRPPERQPGSRTRAANHRRSPANNSSSPRSRSSVPAPNQPGPDAPRRCPRHPQV